MKKESRAMTIRNNNSGMIKRLAQAEYRSNKSRNRLMMLAVAMTVIVIFCIFTVMKGRIDAEYLRALPQILPLKILLRHRLNRLKISHM